MTFLFLFMFQRLKQQTQNQTFYGHQVWDLLLFSRGLTTKKAKLLYVTLVLATRNSAQRGKESEFCHNIYIQNKMCAYYKLAFYFIWFFKMVEVEGGNFNSKERKLLCNNFSPPLRISSSKRLVCLEHKSEGTLQILTSFRAASTAFI